MPRPGARLLKEKIESLSMGEVLARQEAAEMAFFIFFVAWVRCIVPDTKKMVRSLQ